MFQLRCALVGCLAALLLPSADAAAQDPPAPSSFGSIITTVVRDPSVYAPAAAKYASMQLDWTSSQIFFRHGFIERNKRFTVSGRWNDTPLSYGAGNRRVALHAGAMLGWWTAGNIAERTVEKILIDRFENRRKLVSVAGQAARFAGATFFTYSSSIGHLRQWRRNEQMARQLGFK
jgi:hypothetical protein